MWINDVFCLETTEMVTIRSNETLKKKREKLRKSIEAVADASAGSSGKGNFLDECGRA
jgi:hypothetical protein